MKALALICLATAAWAQPLVVYSEFVRVDTTNGDVIAPETPREIISPAAVRKGFTSFQVVVRAAPEDKWWLFVGQNPEDAFKVTLYKEDGESLQPVDLPIQSQGAQVFWMDVWTDADAPVRRVKLEPELNLHDDWVTYPMEVRVVDAVVPETSPLARTVCGLTQSAISTDVARRQLRNADQDGALSTKLPKDEVEKLAALCDEPPPVIDKRFWSEDYLRIRDSLFRLR
jgi:hypothetical protein